MELDFNTKIRRSKKFKELPSKNIVPLSDVHKEYPHLTFRINSLLEYLQIVKLMTTAHAADETLVFRGMSKSDWLAVPSLARYTGNSHTIEYEMVSEFMTVRPEAFQGLQSNFEILAKMQHYGLPTRLLDFTANPMVALYFACADNPKNDARILCSSTFLSDSQDQIIESICGSCKKFSLVNLRIEDLLINTGFTPYEYIARLYLQREFRPLFVKPWYWNQRIVNQGAIFLVFANKLFDRSGKIAYYEECTANDEETLQNQVRTIVEYEALDEIYPIWLSAPDGLVRRNFSVNYETMQKLFSFYKRAELIQQNSHQYTEFGQTILGRRFLFNENIEKIDTDSMRTMFCSIIIDKKAKKEIISDLESIGIDKAFIYPELEYTAEKIKRKYF